MFGITPMEDLQKEAFDDLEEGISSAGISKLKKVKLSLRDENTLNKHATHEQIENIRLRKNKRLLIIEMNLLREQLTLLAKETGFIERGNEALRLVTIEELTGVVRYVMDSLRKEKGKVEELTKYVNSKNVITNKAIEKADEKLELLNKVEKRLLSEKRKVKRNEKVVEKRRKRMEKLEIKLKEEEKTQKLRQERSEINFKASIKKKKQVDTIHKDVEKKRKLVSQAEQQVKAGRQSIAKKEEQLKTREIAVKDKENSVRRLIQEARKAGISI